MLLLLLLRARARRWTRRTRVDAGALRYTEVGALRGFSSRALRLPACEASHDIHEIKRLRQVLNKSQDAWANIVRLHCQFRILSIRSFPVNDVLCCDPRSVPQRSTESMRHMLRIYPRNKRWYSYDPLFT
jgi:hypothetical protein